MKRRYMLALLALCTILGAAGCGSPKKETTTEKQTEASAAETTKTKEAESVLEEEPETAPDAAIGRLVSVKKPQKYLDLGTYKGMELEDFSYTVTEEDVDARISEILSDNAEYLSGDEKVENGDIILMDCSGTVDGVAFETGVENDATLVIGSGTMIAGFEEALVGAKTGETVTFATTFPEDYWSADMAGKEAVFTVTINNIRRAPELTDAWVEANTEWKTVEEYRKSVEEDYQKEYDQYVQETLMSTAWTTLFNETEVKEYPEEDLQAAMAEAHQQFLDLAAESGMELEEFLATQSMTTEELETMERQYAEEIVKQALIVQAILDAEDIDLEDELSQSIRQELLAWYGVGDLAELMTQFSKTRVDNAIALRRVEYFLVEHAKIALPQKAEVTPTGEPEATEIVGQDGVDSGAYDSGAALSAPEVDSADEVDMGAGDGTTNEEAFKNSGIAVVSDDGEAE